MNNNRKAIIEYLYLDLSVCDRCIGTDEVLDHVIDVLEPALQLAGYEDEVYEIPPKKAGKRYFENLVFRQH